MAPSIASLSREGYLGRAPSLLSDDVDHPTHCLGAVKRASRAPEDFNTLHVLSKQMGEVEIPGSNTVHLHPVHQYERLVRVGAANKNGRRTAARARLDHIHTGYMAQDLFYRRCLLAPDITRGDHGKRCGRLLLWCFGPGCRHYHGRQGLFLLRLRSGRSIGEENEKQDEKEKIHKISFSRERGVLGQNGQVSWLRLYQPAEKGPSASLRLPRSLQRTAKVRFRSRRFARLASGTFL